MEELPVPSYRRWLGRSKRESRVVTSPDREGYDRKACTCPSEMAATDRGCPIHGDGAPFEPSWQREKRKRNEQHVARCLREWQEARAPHVDDRVRHHVFQRGYARAIRDVVEALRAPDLTTDSAGEWAADFIEINFGSGSSPETSPFPPRRGELRREAERRVGLPSGGADERRYRLARAFREFIHDQPLMNAASEVAA